MITREEAMKLLRKYIKTENTIKHMLATECIMRVLAKRLEPEKEENWALAGLLHDLDYEVMTEEKEHGEKTVEILKEKRVDLPEEVFQAIKAHCFNSPAAKRTPDLYRGEPPSRFNRDSTAPIEESPSTEAGGFFNLNPSFEPKSLMDWSLFICDSLTGLIVATALVRPDKKLSSVEVASVMKKFKEKSFARNTRREDIKMCEEKLGVPLREFVEICLSAMQGIADDLGL
jgi:putative nucleotidyltransferase with HDIG domain